MSNFLRRLKLLPWREMLQIAALVNSIVIGVELFLAWGFTQSRAIRNVVTLLYGSSLGILIPFVAAVGMGALAVYFLEHWHQQYLLNKINLWVLVLCVLFGLLLKSFLPIPPLLASLSEASLIGITVGVFWKGRPYWR
ncbi:MULTISPECIES: peptide chain release factor 1 [Microcoleaceae]|uniref:peptide chain release factor 1 n=1 Tax=Microcoleaceae TaxID=1892252 RepID=UPI001880A46F|nr:peptide chain release factor 1 [Tychonema sp. LEGE 06208]MBE9161080.1 peptide chain release factor 1 [Tychonema sp. LEGE 06208]